MSCLVIFNKQLGDTLLLQPALAKLAAHHGGPVRLIAPPAFEPLVRLMPGVEPVRLSWKSHEALYCYDAGSRSLRQSFFSRSSSKQITALSSTYLKWRHRRVFDKLSAERTCERYVAKYYWDHSPGEDSNLFKPPRLLPPPPAWRHPQAPNAGHILVNPVSAWQNKSYTIAGWRFLVEQLLSASSADIWISGGSEPWQRDLCNAIVDGFPQSRVRDFSGQTSLQQFLFLVSGASLVVAVDGSACHLGGAFDRPTLSLFGPSKPSMWHRPAETQIALSAREYSTEKNPPASVIPPEAAWAACARLLESRANTKR